LPLGLFFLKTIRRPCAVTGTNFQNTQQFVQTCRFTMFHCCNKVYLQHGDVLPHVFDSQSTLV